jgi:hypothetical protein
MKTQQDVINFMSGNPKPEIVRILPISDQSSFSKDTKITITPSIPFSVNFNGKDVTIKSMSLYHPCPIQLEGIQYDAVLSLNDPSDENRPSHIILVPLMTSNRSTTSTKFFSKICPQLALLYSVDPVTNDYPTLDVPTDSNWSLTNLFGMSPNDNEYKGGLFSWTAAPDYAKTTQSSNNVITVDYKPIGNPITYIILDKAVEINSGDLSLLRRLPVTPAAESIHPMIKETLHYKKQSCSSSSSTSKENFENIESCDPFQQFPVKKQPLQSLISWIFNLLWIFTALASIYLALYIIDNRYHDDLIRFINNFSVMLVNQIRKIRGREMLELKNLGDDVSETRDKAGDVLSDLTSKIPGGISDLTSKIPGGIGDLTSKIPGGLGGITSKLPGVGGLFSKGLSFLGK